MDSDAGCGRASCDDDVASTLDSGLSDDAEEVRVEQSGRRRAETSFASPAILHAGPRGDLLSAGRASPPSLSTSSTSESHAGAARDPRIAERAALVPAVSRQTGRGTCGIGRLARPCCRERADRPAMPLQRSTVVGDDQRVLDIRPAGFVQHSALSHRAAGGREPCRGVGGRRWLSRLSAASTLSAAVLLVLAATPTDSPEATSPVWWTLN
jgi:hypothetical protein